MDSTRPAHSRLKTVLAVSLGAVVAVPLAGLFAAVYYVRVTGIGLLAVARFLTSSPKQRSRAGPKKGDGRSKRLAS